MTDRLNRHCAYFPCHERLGDCTFCYCPFYPCKDKHLGMYIITRDKRRVWSCEDCNWIHNKNVVDRIFNMIRNSNLKRSITVDKFRLEDTGVIILGHGSKLKRANDLLYRLAQKIRSENGLDIVEPAFLQLYQPDLRKAIRKVVKRGCKRVIIVPFFLFEGNHVSRDIPKVIKEEARIHKKVELVYAKNLGQDYRISSIVMDCIREASE